MTKPQQYTARFEEKQAYNEKYHHFHFELINPPRMPFQAGQYVSVSVNDEGDRRSYSVCSRPDIDHGIELLIDMEPQGLGPTFFDSLSFGQEISFLGPLGQFTLQEGNNALVFIATGSGITPFRSMITELLQVNQDSRPITLYWGLRFVKHLFWQDEIEELSEHFDNFSFYPVISKPVPEWNLSSGHVTDLIQIHKFEPNTGFYLCGGKNMIEDVTEVLVDKKVDQSNIYHEKFF